MANIYDTLPGDDDAPKANVYDTIPGDDAPSPVKERVSDVSEGLLGPSEVIASTAANIPYGVFHGAAGLLKDFGANDAGASVDKYGEMIHVPMGDAGKQLMGDIPGVVDAATDGLVGSAYNTGKRWLSSADDAIGNYSPTAQKYLHKVGDIAGHASEVAPALSPLAKVRGLMRSAAAEDAPALTAPRTAALPVAGTGSQQTLSAMRATPDLSVADPALRQAIEATPNPHDVALERHLDTAQLTLPEGTSPLRLRKGQAIGDDQQISDEKNLRADPDTQGILTDSINDQNQKLGASIGEIRRRATPDIVQRTNAEHDQAVIDAIKAHDNAMVLDTRAKYKALADANGGAMPIDTQAMMGNLNARLDREYLNDTVNESKVLRPIMSDLRSGNPIPFERFESMRSRLAEVQRAGGSDGAAAGMIHDALESMPLPPEAAPLKALADEARASAKARFDIRKVNPAYEAAINDNVPKVTVNGSPSLHDVGAKSPLAGNFLETYATGNGRTANPALVSRLKQAVPDPVIGQSIEAATLNKLRDASGIDEFGAGNFRNNQFHTALGNLTNKGKAESLLSPDSLDRVRRLDRVSGYVNNEGKGSATNRSNTMVALQRFGAVDTALPATAETSPLRGTINKVADMGTDYALGHVSPAAAVAKHVAQGFLKERAAKKAAAAQEAAKKAADQSVRDAKLKFALDAVKPGAGLDYVPPAKPTEMPTAPSPIARASGGRVSEDELVERLIKRWKQAKRETDRSTKPILALPDSAVIHALNIAQRSI